MQGKALHSKVHTATAMLMIFRRLASVPASGEGVAASICTSRLSVHNKSATWNIHMPEHGHAGPQGAGACTLARLMLWAAAAPGSFSAHASLAATPRAATSLVNVCDNPSTDEVRVLILSSNNSCSRLFSCAVMVCNTLKADEVL